MPSRRIHLRELVLVSVLTLTISPPLRAQESQPEQPTPDARSESTDSASEPISPVLLREGSRLVRAQGTLHRDESSRAWQVVLSASDNKPRYVLTIQPTALLEETEALLLSLPDADYRVEISGTVQVYRSRNYLIPAHPPVLLGTAPKPIDESRRTNDAETALSTEESSENADTESDAAEDIIASLEQNIGPVARRADPSSASTIDATNAQTWSEDVAPVREGTIITSRRGTIVRSARGAFLFIFDADAEGLLDPPMVLLPCLLLERIERYQQQRGASAEALLDGQVYTYRGRNYLLVDIFRIPRERTELTP